MWRFDCARADFGDHSVSTIPEVLTMSTLDANRVIMTGENPFIRLGLTDGDVMTTNASLWRILFSPSGPGHVLYLKSELTQDAWRTYSDNIAMARWLQSTVQACSTPNCST
jgi:hypothetical protein